MFSVDSSTNCHDIAQTLLKVALPNLSCVANVISCKTKRVHIDLQPD